MASTVFRPCSLQVVKKGYLISNFPFFVPSVDAYTLQRQFSDSSAPRSTTVGYYIFKTTKAIRRLLWLDYAPWHLGPTNYPEQWRTGPAWNYRAIFGNSSRCLLRSSRHCSWDIVFNWSIMSILWISQSITWHRALKPIGWNQHPGRANCEPCFQPVLTSPFA